MKASICPPCLQLAWIVEDSVEDAAASWICVLIGLKIWSGGRHSYRKSSNIPSDREGEEKNQKGDWQVKGAGSMQMKHFGLFASSQSDRQRTEGLRPMSIHVPGRRQKTQPGHTFQPASAPAHKLNPRDFPFEREKRGYNITSFRPRERLVGVTGRRDSCHSLFETFPDLGFTGSQDLSVVSRRGVRSSQVCSLLLTEEATALHL